MIAPKNCHCMLPYVTQYIVTGNKQHVC